MAEPLVYRLNHSTGSVEISLTDERLVVKTQGTGLADRLRTVEIAVADLRHFMVTPTTTPQNTMGARGAQVIDASRNAEMLFSYASAGQVAKKRLFVNAHDPAFVAISSRLQALRPDASLLHMTPREAYKTLGVLSPQQGLLIVVAAIIGLPLLVLLGWVLSRILH